VSVAFVLWRSITMEAPLRMLAPVSARTP